MEGPYYLGIDVGTGSARAGIFTKDGRLVGHAAHDIRQRKNAFEQSSSDIWQAVCTSVKTACTATNIPGVEAQIAALGVDATCSLVAVDEETYEPVSVVANTHPSHVEEGQVWNIILWLDHRALQEASDLNEMGDVPAVRNVLKQFGDRISPENEPPKLLWLKRNLPARISHCAFFDLADWVTFKCTGDATSRSSCTVSCKWGWGATEPKAWNAAFWEQIGLGELAANGFKKIGGVIRQPGEPAGRLAAAAAAELGLSTEVVVATALIDAHCAAVGTVGAQGTPRADAFPLSQRLALAAGTSSCMLAMTPAPVHVPGVWGPFPASILANYSLSEAGQSVSGALLKHVVHSHAAYPSLRDRVGSASVFDELDRLALHTMQTEGKDPAHNVHVLDAFAGNRSPLADPTVRGVVVGLTLQADEESLVALYRATMLALCYGTRLIVQRMNEAGHEVRAIFATGGITVNRTFQQEIANVCGMPVFLPREREATLLGGAIIAATAHSAVKDEKGVSLQEQMNRMSGIGEVFEPKSETAGFHQGKYDVYLKMYEHQREYREIMQ